MFRIAQQQEQDGFGREHLRIGMARRFERELPVRRLAARDRVRGENDLESLVQCVKDGLQHADVRFDSGDDQRFSRLCGERRPESRFDEG